MKKSCLLVAALATAPLAAMAQDAPAPAAVDPRAASPAIEYRSAFAGYRSFSEQEPGRWKEVLEGLGPLWWGPGSQAPQPSTLRIIPREPQKDGAAPHHGQPVRPGEK